MGNEGSQADATGASIAPKATDAGSRNESDLIANGIAQEQAKRQLQIEKCLAERAYEITSSLQNQMILDPAVYDIMKLIQQNIRDIDEKMSKESVDGSEARTSIQSITQRNQMPSDLINELHSKCVNEVAKMENRYSSLQKEVIPNNEKLLASLEEENRQLKATLEELKQQVLSQA